MKKLQGVFARCNANIILAGFVLTMSYALVALCLYASVRYEISQSASIIIGSVIAIGQAPILLIVQHYFRKRPDEKDHD